MNDLLSGLGLLVGMAGTVFGFFWGFPQPQVGHALLLESSPSAEESEAIDRARRLKSYVGLALLFAAFALQFTALAVGD
jgi:hypothetical protein